MNQTCIPDDSLSLPPRSMYLQRN